MSNDIVKTLKVMCSQDEPQDKKLLLLAELVETKFESLSQQQEIMQKSIGETNGKLDKVTELLEQIQEDEKSCPVHSNRGSFEKISFVMKYPRLSLFMLMGIFAILTGVFGEGVFTIIKGVFGL